MQRRVSVITHEENRLPAHFSLTCFLILVDSYNDSVIYLNRITTGRHCAVFSKKTRGFFSYCSGWILSPCQFCPLVQCAVSAKCSHSQHTATYTRGNTSIWLLCCSAVLSMWLATLLPNKCSLCLLPVVIYSQIHPCPVHFIPKEKSFSNWTECGPWGLTLHGDRETEYFVGMAMWMNDENRRLTGLMLR